VTGQLFRYTCNRLDPSTISSNNVRFAGEDRAGRFWVVSDGGLDLFDRASGKVIRHVSSMTNIFQFHEDQRGKFWISTTMSSCPLATLDTGSYNVTCHRIDYESNGLIVPVKINSMLESRDGTMWFASALAGLLKLDRERKQLISYHNDPMNKESLGSENVVSLFQDKEGTIWTCLQETPPNFFSETPSPFHNFTYQQGILVNPLVTVTYEDHNQVLWIGTMAGLSRIDRGTGKVTINRRSGAGNEILSILETRSGGLLAGTFHQGLERLNTKTGELVPFAGVGKASSADKNGIMRLLFDHKGTLWAATLGGLSRLDTASGQFVTYTPDSNSPTQYQEIKEDRHGMLWLGAQHGDGVHRFDASRNEFKIYKHRPEDSRSLSDNRVNSILFDSSGRMWVGTQNGLDQYDESTNSFRTYYQQDGLSGDVVSCILQDQRGELWISTNNGLSSFDAESRKFRNFFVADGLPGGDLTGWGACGQTKTGEMIFGGFSGATLFNPNDIQETSPPPGVVLTDFRLSGNPVAIGSNSLLKQSITYTKAITLSHHDEMFSIEFSALSYFNSESVRYRYKLDGLEGKWREVGSDQRTVNYTTLPAGSYVFEVQSATNSGIWSEPGTALRIHILPAWYQTLWFRSGSVLVFLFVLWRASQLRSRQIERQFHAAFDARVDERTHIARELHDTLLQSFHGLILRLQAVRDMLPEQPGTACEALDSAIGRAAAAVTESRHAVQALRGEEESDDLGESLATIDREFRMDVSASRRLETNTGYRVLVEGTALRLHPVVRDNLYRIAREAIRNAFRHAHANQIDVNIRYDHGAFRLRVRDNGGGIDPQVLSARRLEGHYGLPGMRER
jgi:signal transduction histidine kinase/streptogramin lyase